ncbi:MAG: ATP-binding protein [Candidatus Omnitrophota bacterium]|nr:ATP-binding protein [Candidatus Omnitrophota bacterium]
MPGQSKEKRGIRRKVILVICLATLTVITIGIGMGYLFGANVLRGMVGDVHRKMSHILADRVTKALDSEIARIKGCAGDPLWREALSNAASEAALPKVYLAGNAAVRLRELAKDDNNIARLSVLDRRGAPVAASAELDSPAAQQGLMLKRVLADGRAIFVGSLYFDKVLRAWVITTAVPVVSGDGSTIGIFRADIACENFFAPLGDFRVDRTGHAFIIDEGGKIIFHPGQSQKNVRFCGDRDYEKLLTNKNKYAVLYEPDQHEKKMFVAFSEVAPPLLLENRIVWRVVVDQEAEEVFAPLKGMFLLMPLAVALLLIIMVPVGFVFSNVIVEPIHKLHGAAVEIMRGNWDYPIDIRTGDEIEAFADAFKEMVATIKSNQESLFAAKKELEKFSRTLEDKIGERTKELMFAKNEIDEYAKELEKAILIKSDFVSTASHELRTPLAAIREGLALVLDQKAGVINEHQRDFLDMAKKNVDRLGRIINDILDFQKLEYGKQSLKMELNDINEVVKDVKNTMASVAEAKGLTIMASLDETLPNIKFDRDKIIQVITNLVNNAIKFTEKGNIDITTGRGDNVVGVAVSDSGIGIKKEDISKLFQKFVQIDTGLERKPGGTGLGLAISHSIIQMHKGKIWAESKYGHGAVFRFILPITERRV